MTMASRFALTLLVAGLLAAGLAACGAADDSSSTPASTAAGFRTPGGDNSIQEYGDEADPAEREQASANLVAFMEARAAGDWAGQCASIARVAVEPLEQLATSSAKLKGKGCAAILAALQGKAPASTRKNTMPDGIDSLRVEGERGFAMYHGSDGSDYFIPLVNEDGAWKVGALAPGEFP